MLPKISFEDSDVLKFNPLNGTYRHLKVSQENYPKVIEMLIKTMSNTESNEEIVKRYNQAVKACPKAPYTFFTIDGEADITPKKFDFSRVYGAIQCDNNDDISILYVSASGKGKVSQVRTVRQQTFLEFDPITGEEVEHTKDVVSYVDRVISEEFKAKMNEIVERKIIEYVQGRIM